MGSDERAVTPLWSVVDLDPVSFENGRAAARGCPLSADQNEALAPALRELAMAPLDTPSFRAGRELAQSEPPLSAAQIEVIAPALAVLGRQLSTPDLPSDRALRGDP